MAGAVEFGAARQRNLNVSTPEPSPASQPTLPPALPPHSPALAAFLAAVAAGVDEATEARVATLTPDDEPALLVLTVHPSEDLRWWVLRALADCGAADSADALAAAARDPSPDLRSVAALGFGHLHARAPQAVAPHLELLAGLLQDDDGFVRQAAVDGLALCGESALPVLGELLATSNHQGARTRAASALRTMRSIKAAPLLYRCLNDPNHLVHTFAYEALDDLGLLDNVLLLP